MTYKRLLFLICVLVPLFISSFCLAVVYSEDFDTYDLGAVSEQQGWSTSTGGYPLEIQNWAGNQALGTKNSYGVWYDNTKRYFTESRNGSIEFWVWAQTDSAMSQYGKYFDLKSSAGDTCFRFWLAKIGPPNENWWYYTDGFDRQVQMVNLNKAQKITLSWSNASGSLKFNLQVPVYNTTTSYYDTGWLSAYDSDCDFDVGVSYLTLTWKINGETEGMYLLDVDTEGEDAVIWPPDTIPFYNESYVSGVSINYSEFDATSSTWDFGVKVQGINDYLMDEGWDLLFLDVYDENNVLLFTQFKGVAYEDLADNLMDDLQMPFSLDYTFADATGSATTTSNYILRFSFFNIASSTYKTSQDFYLHLNPDTIYRTNYQYQLEREQAVSQDIDTWLDAFGIFGKIVDYFSFIKLKFPFSWLFGIYDTWIEISEETYATSTPPVLTMTLPTSSAYLGGTSFTLVDMNTAYTQYATYIDSFRTILGLIIWIVVSFVIIDKTKNFIYHLNEH